MRRLLIVLGLLVVPPLGAACSVGEPAEPQAPPLEGPAVGYLAQRLRRLGSRELAQSIFDVTGIAVPDARVSPLFTRRKYDNGDPDAWVTSDVLAATEDLAWFVADEVVRTRPARVFAGCAEAACKAQLLGTVVPRIYRRELTSAEQTSYGALWDDGARVDGDEALRGTLAAALQSPVFLYREEVGRIAAGASVARLEPPEIAAQLSFLVTGSTPDDELLGIARDGRLLGAEARLAQVTRLIRTPAALAMQRHFLDLYLATAEVTAIRKSPTVYPGFNAGAALAADLHAMFDEVIASGGSTQVLLTQSHPIGDPLRAQYGGGPPIQGVMMHPAFLATLGGFENSNPVARGLFVLTNLLCAPPPPPPPGIPRAPGETSPTNTTRAKFAAHSAGSCQACHKAIDGIGFGFEEFDGAGQFRQTENGQPVDASGLLPLEGHDVRYDGVAELTARLASSQQVADCFAKHVVRFALGAGERAVDAPLYERMAQESGPSTTYEQRIRRIVASEGFITRRTTP